MTLVHSSLFSQVLFIIFSLDKFSFLDKTKKRKKKHKPCAFRIKKMFDFSTTLIFQHLIDRVVQKSMLLEWRNEKLQIIMHDMDIKKGLAQCQTFLVGCLPLWNADALDYRKSLHNFMMT